MPISTMIRFRLWHLFALVGIVGFCLWLITQVGMETAEIEILQFDTWPRTGLVETEAPIAVVNVKFRYVRPEELSQTTVNLFFGEPGYTDAKNIDVGTRIRFRYRVRPMMWLKPVKPDPMAIRSLGLDERNIEEIITEVNLPIEN